MPVTIPADLAYRLELANLGSARQYLAEQAAYDLWQAKHRKHPPIARLRFAGSPLPTRPALAGLFRLAAGQSGRRRPPISA